MSKFKVQMKSKIQTTKNIFGIWPFDIDLTFACLPQAGVLTFGIYRGE